MFTTLEKQSLFKLKGVILRKASSILPMNKERINGMQFGRKAKGNYLGDSVQLAIFLYDLKDLLSLKSP